MIQHNLSVEPCPTSSLCAWSHAVIVTLQTETAAWSVKKVTLSILVCGFLVSVWLDITPLFQEIPFYKIFQVRNVYRANMRYASKAW